MSISARQSGTEGKKLTLRMARASVTLTLDGKRLLDLSNTQMMVVPRCLLKLADVVELDLSRNLLREVPDWIGRFTNLRRLDLHSNLLRELPGSVADLHNLSNLNLCNNRLTAAGLPPELGQLRRLRILNLGLNRLERIPFPLAPLRELRELGLFHNLLDRLPECVHKLPELHKLNTTGNPLAGPPPNADTIRRAGGLYLVDGDCLCRPCLRRCQVEKLRLGRMLPGGDEESKLTFSGMLTPNSVAMQDQALWR